jgi:hemerythrin-like domain-containing protein
MRVEQGTRLIEAMILEHCDIKEMLAVLDAAASQLDEGRVLTVDVLSGLVDWFEGCGDSHHISEERTLFPLLARHGLGPDKVVVSALLSQHEAGRAYTRKMREALVRISCGDPEGVQAFIGQVRGYVELIREHIRIEDEYFYRLAADLLTDAEREQLLRQLERSEKEGQDSPERRRFARMFDDYRELARQWQATAR